MVAALNCRQEDGYNSFVRRFQPDLRGAYRHVNNHFRRAGGVRKLDEYITNLANAQSQEGIRQGAAFCNNMAPVWQQVLALPNRPNVIWGQLTVRNDEAAKKAEDAGVTVIMDRCPAIEYPRLIG